MRYIEQVLDYVWGNPTLLVSIAAIAASATQIGVKLLSKSTCFFQIMCIRTLCVCIVMYLVVQMRQELLFGDPRWYRLFILRTISASLSFLTLHFSTHLLPLVDAAFLVNTYPMTTAIISFVLQLEELTWRSWTGVVGCVIGSALILQPEFLVGGDNEDWDLERITGVILALFSTVLTSVNAICTAIMGTSISPYGSVFAAVSLVFCLSVPFVALSFPKAANWSPNFGQILLHVLVVVAGLLFHPVFVRGFQIGPPTKNGIIMLTNMLYSALFGILVMSDDASWYTLLGAVFIIISVVLISLDKSKPQSSVQQMNEVHETEQPLAL
eukprot:g7991.t1